MRGDRGAVFLVLAPHNHPAHQSDPDDASAQIDLIGVVDADNLGQQAIFVNYASGAATPLDPEVV
jgi:hypothetical protein